MASFSLYRSTAHIVVLNSNFYYLHLVLHKFSVEHVSYSSTLSGRIGNNYVVVKILIKLTPNKYYSKIYVVRIN